MSESASVASAIPQSGEATAPPTSLATRYRQDHRNPVNHFLHVGVGWPLVAVSVVLLPFRPLRALALLVAAYAIMFFGHFVFERNAPTVLKHPSTPFVVAWSVIRSLCGGVVRVAMPRRGR